MPLEYDTSGNNEVVIDADSDIYEAFASAPNGAVIIFKPGVYQLESALVVKKDVMVKSSTGNARDVTIVREGATALLVKDGSPVFEDLTFLSPTRTGVEDAADFDDEIGYQSCVAVRGGKPTFRRCRATSAEQSGFAARGKGVELHLDGCEVYRPQTGAVFFDEGAIGTVENCVFIGARLGAIDVEETSEGERVVARGCRIVSGESVCLCVHNGGALVVSDSVLSTKYLCAFVDGGSLDVANTSFSSYEEESPDEEFKYQGGGLYCSEAKVSCESCHFEKFQWVSLIFRSDVVLKDCDAEEYATSFILDSAENAPRLIDTTIEGEPKIAPNEEETQEKAELDDAQNEEEEEFEDDRTSFFDQAFTDPYAEENELSEADVPFTQEEFEQAVELKEKILEDLLGPSAPITRKVGLSFYQGGPVDGFFYPNSRYGGVFFVTKQLSLPGLEGLSNRHFDSYELAMATRLPCPDSVLTKEEIERFDVKMNDVVVEDESEEKMADFCLVLSALAHYAASGEVTFNQYETLEFPADFEIEQLAGRCFVFDILGTPREGSRSSWEKLLDLFDKDEETLCRSDRDEAGGAEREKERGAFGLLLVIEVFRSEMQYAQRLGGINLIPHLRESKVWPFSDLDRDPTV